MTDIAFKQPGSRLAAPALGAAVIAATVLAVVAFDQGALATVLTDVGQGSGGAFHEFFHDARHLLGAPCH